MDYGWDENKASSNRRKHGVDFADAVSVFADDAALTVPDEYPDEERFVTIGMDALGQILVVVYTWRGDAIRIISARKATWAERKQYEAYPMKDEYDFSHGTRGAIDPAPLGKTRITIRLDDEVLDWFRSQVHLAGGGNYQTLINDALRDYIRQRKEPLEETLRRVLREELHNL